MHYLQTTRIQKLRVLSATLANFQNTHFQGFRVAELHLESMQRSPTLLQLLRLRRFPMHRSHRRMQLEFLRVTPKESAHASRRTLFLKTDR